MKRVFALLLLLVCISSVAPLHAQTPPPTAPQPWYERYQQAWSTGLSAFVGFAGLIVVTVIGFRQNKKMQQTQARLDREAQERHWRSEIERQDREQVHEMRMEASRQRRDAIALANALAAELRHILGRIAAFSEHAETMADGWEKYAAESDHQKFSESSFNVGWEARNDVYTSNTHRIGELPDLVAYSVIYAYGCASKSDPYRVTTPESAAIIIRGNKRLGKLALDGIEEAISLLDKFRNGDDEPELPIG